MVKLRDEKMENKTKLNGRWYSSTNFILQDENKKECHSGQEVIYMLENTEYANILMH